MAGSSRKKRKKKSVEREREKKTKQKLQRSRVQEREEEEGRSSCHKFNIIDEIADEFKYVSNFVCKNDMPSYFLVFFLFFFTIIPWVYTDEIFSSVFIDGYCEDIFSRKNSL